MKGKEKSDPAAYKEQQAKILAERSKDIKYALAHYVNIQMLLKAKTMELYANMQQGFGSIQIGEEIFKIHSSQPAVAKDIRHYGL